MKPGMRVIEKQQVGDRTVWLASDDYEWATYVSISANPNETEHGHYFESRSTAVADFTSRVKAYRP